jgi:hypothetical protein
MSISQKLAIVLFLSSAAIGAQAKDAEKTVLTRSYLHPGTYLVDLLAEEIVFEGELFECDPTTTACDSQTVIQFQQGGTLSQMGEFTNFVFGEDSSGDSLRIRTLRLGDWKQVQYNKVSAKAIRFGDTFGPVSDNPFFYGSTTIIEYDIELSTVDRTFSGAFQSRTYTIDQDPYDPSTIPTQVVTGLIVNGAPLFAP